MTDEPSTRIGINSSKNLEVHLKQSLQIDNELYNAVGNIDLGKNWHIAMHHTQNNKWNLANSYNNFTDADKHFVTRCSNNGIDAKRLTVNSKTVIHA